MPAGAPERRARPASLLRMHAVRCFVFLTLVIGGCSDPGTATGPHSAPEAGPAPLEATPATANTALAESSPDPASSSPPDGPAGDDDDSSAPTRLSATVTAQASAPGTMNNKELLCADRIDNDGDRAVDCDDTDCWSVAACEAPEPGDWADQGPGPDLGVDGEKAPGPEGADGGPMKPEDDGIGVACADYIGCVCGLAKAEAGRTIGGYSHVDACEEARSLVGNKVEEYCGEELDRLKGVLDEVSEAYAEAKIKMPGPCN